MREANLLLPPRAHAILVTRVLHGLLEGPKGILVRSQKSASSFPNSHGTRQTHRSILQALTPLLLDSFLNDFKAHNCTLRGDVARSALDDLP